MAPSARAAARAFGRIEQDFHARGWVLGTSGNFKTVLSRRPMRLAIAASGVSKGVIQAKNLAIGPEGKPVGKPMARPSAEALLHIVAARGSFPDFRNETDDALLAERRLAYVAVTRAARVLVLSRSRIRATRLGSRVQEPSQFLAELGPESVAKRQQGLARTESVQSDTSKASP